MTDISLNNEKKPELYKTEMCRNWEEMGQCRYSKKCCFAHGKEELRTIQRHQRYKTQVCRTYHLTGTCLYGVRCTFIHDDNLVLSTKSTNTLSTSSSISSSLSNNKESNASIGLSPNISSMSSISSSSSIASNSSVDDLTSPKFSSLSLFEPTSSSTMNHPQHHLNYHTQSSTMNSHFIPPLMKNSSSSFQLFDFPNPNSSSQQKPLTNPMNSHSSLFNTSSWLTDSSNSNLSSIWSSSSSSSSTNVNTNVNSHPSSSPSSSSSTNFPLYLATSSATNHFVW